MTATLDLTAARTAAWEAFDRRHGEHVASLQEFVRIPSARGEELAAQQWMARRMRDLGLDVEMIECDPDALARYPTWSPTDWSYENRPNVAGRWPGVGGGRSLILNAHVDTTSPEPVELWSRDPWGGEIDGNRLYARGAQDDKAGCCEMLFVVQALQDAGLRLKGDLILETTIDEECSGNGSLALVAAGYEADGVLMLDGTGLGRAIVAHPGHVAFRVTIHGKPVPYHIGHPRRERHREGLGGDSGAARAGGEKERERAAALGRHRHIRFTSTSTASPAASGSARSPPAACWTGPWASCRPRPWPTHGPRSRRRWPQRPRRTNGCGTIRRRSRSRDWLWSRWTWATTTPW